jgi:NADPH-dependent glutamate synthase beta subunit-like oxidoreductase
MKLPSWKIPDNGKNICIAGAGPAGLAAGYFLRRLGYSCDIFEAKPEAGGILRWGIPRYRLPGAVLKNEIARIEDSGVNIHCDTPVTSSFFNTASSKYSGFFIGCGLGRSLQMKIPGEEMAFDGLKFLSTMRTEEIASFNGTAAVVGGGNTAIDVARSLTRLGAKTLLVYRRRKQDMPAFQHEVEMAVKEGVEIIELVSPVRIEKNNNAYVLTLQQMKVTDKGMANGRARVVPEGEANQQLRAHKIFIAIGAEADEPWQHAPDAENGVLSLSHCTISVADRPMVFGGDLTNRTKSVADAIASGKQAAIALDTFFRKGLDAITERLASCRVGNGDALSMDKYLDGEGMLRIPHTVSYQEINGDYFSKSSRATPSYLSPEQRLRSFSEIEDSLTIDQAMGETRRCFNCGICNACDNCRLFCPELAVILEGAQRQIDLDYCKGCGICVTECPRNAMTLKEER